METGRWCGLKREEKAGMQCTQQEVENKEHFLLHCKYLSQEREVVKRYKSEVDSGRVLGNA